ncbi:MAG TPA: MFS transporter, partial [Gaiellales bacterium]|nr:MFS transporter [Gaiellales bacterium]
MIARILRGRVHYAWVVAAATFVVLLTAAGFRATPGVLLLPLQHEFGWSPALIGGAVAVNLLVYGLGAPFAAAIVERFGLRRVTVIALTTVAVGAGLTTQMTSPWQLYLLWGLVVGGATGAVAVPLAAIVANRWFSTRRGLVTGMLTASNASGQLVFLPLLAWVVTSYSWRAAAALIALTAILVVVPVALVFLRTDPADVGLMPYGAVEPEPPRRLLNPFRNAVGALRDAVRVRDFWLLAGAFFICGATTNGLIGTHLIAACADHGLSEVRGAGLLAAIGVFDVVRDAAGKRDFWLLASAFFICGATTNGLIGTHLIAACADHGLSADFGAGMLATIGIFNVVGATCSGWL